jgi:NAD(P)H-hydrate epimerase
MATAGSGDSLTGIIGALLAQRMDALEAACLGVYLHGRAGDIACVKKGEVGMIAGDIIESIPEAIRELEGEHVCLSA